MLKINNLYAQTVEQSLPILKDLHLQINPGEFHALMGVNGSGKSTLANVLAGNPEYMVTQGSILFDKQDLLSLQPDQRAQKGLFLSFQQPLEIPGLKISKFLHRIAENNAQNNNQKFSSKDFLATLLQYLKFLDMEKSILNRGLNEGFSGGEKKRLELLQILVLRPKLVIFDEIDSGLDIDALKLVGKTIDRLKESTQFSGLIITHYQRILEYVSVDKIHVMLDGQIKASGDKSLIEQIEQKGYQSFKDNS